MKGYTPSGGNGDLARNGSGSLGVAETLLLFFFGFRFAHEHPSLVAGKRAFFFKGGPQTVSGPVQTDLDGPHRNPQSP